MLPSPTLIFGITLVIIAIVFLSRTRRFYFVRHGETVLNAQWIKQGTAGELSHKGREQAESVGRYLRHYSIGRIISSPYPRAKETSLLIQKHLRVPIVYSPLLSERRSPSEIIGKRTDDPEVVHAVDQTERVYHTDDFRFSDEENFTDLKKRARLCLNVLARQGVHETCIVTHRAFLKMLISYLLYREHLHAADFVKLSFFNISDNAGITVCEFRPWNMLSRTRGWSVVTYNEQPL